VAVLREVLLEHPLPVVAELAGLLEHPLPVVVARAGLLV
jgi:hypothetical protein